MRYVVIETMPDHLRGSHRAAGSWGQYPHNGAKRRIVDQDLANDLVAADGDEYDHVVSDAPVMLAEIGERGNGFPDAGDYVPGDDGELYRIVELASCAISTHGPGRANTICAFVESAGWDDCEEEDVFPASATVVAGTR